MGGLNFDEVVGGLGVIGGGILTATGAGAALGVPLMTGGAGMIGAGIQNDQNAQAQANVNNQNLALPGDAQTFSANEAIQQEQYQTQMSNTAYQRSVADMKAAGLNPILAGMNQTSASSPSGSAPTGQTGPGASAPTYQNALGAGVSSAIAMRSLTNDLSKTDSEIGLNAALGAKALQDAKTGVSSARSYDAAATTAELQFNKVKAQSKADAAKAGYDYKASGYDAIMNRANRDSGTAANVAKMARDFFMDGAIKGIGKSLKPGELHINGNTGEILNEGN